jgi:hypothetical protein
MKGIISIIGILPACILSHSLNAQEPVSRGFNRIEVQRYFISTEYLKAIPARPVPENSSFAFIVTSNPSLVHTASQVAGSVEFILFHENNEEEKEKNLTGPGEVVISAFISPFKALDGFIFGTGPVFLLREGTGELLEENDTGMAGEIIGLEKNNSTITSLVVSTLFTQEGISNWVNPELPWQPAALKNVIYRERQ